VGCRDRPEHRHRLPAGRAGRPEPRLTVRRTQSRGSSQAGAPAAPVRLRAHAALRTWWGGMPRSVLMIVTAVGWFTRTSITCAAASGCLVRDDTDHSRALYREAVSVNFPVVLGTLSISRF